VALRYKYYVLNVCDIEKILRTILNARFGGFALG
jgi:hypothetical protein